MHWYQYTKAQIESELQTNFITGLSQAEATNRFFQNGPNLLPETPIDSWVIIFFRQFKSPLIYILFVCAGIVFYLGDRTDSLIILFVLVFNAVIGVVQEGRSQKTLKSLKRLSDAEATVLRAGTPAVVAEKSVVDGDVLCLEEGQKIVADARVLFSSGLSVDEALLTGESGAVEKIVGQLSGSSLSPAAQTNMVFKGTSVLAGNGKAIVVATGVNTEIGKINKVVSETETEIPLQKNIRQLATLIIYGVVGLSVFIFILGVYFAQRSSIEMFSVVVSLAVSMIPEGLPLVLTLILVTGVYRMSKKNALVKKLQAVEALGQARIIAVDKTGTITKNEMVVKKLWIGGKAYSVSGNGYEPRGGVYLDGVEHSINQEIKLAGKIASLASKGSAILQETGGIYKVSGDPTEAAMSVFGGKVKSAREILLKEYSELSEMPFNYKTKFRAVFYSASHDGVFCAIAGAPETLMENATFYLQNGRANVFSFDKRKEFESVLEGLTQDGLRVVAFGFKHLKKGDVLENIREMVLGGFFAIEDSVRPESRQAVESAQAAGVKIVMITGDHKVTAQAIAKEAGIFFEGDTVLTGQELKEMSNEALKKILPKVSVFARVTPEDKMKIIEAYRNAGLVVAMTGDGVNDAPSLVSADLGVAMGKIGTEVAKEAADIVLLDDNLGSIVSAIEEGRAMYRNIQKSLLYLFSTSAGEALTIILSLILNLPLPILAAQILWLNLVTDPFIGSALALDKKDPNLLSKDFPKPRKYFIDGNMLSQMILTAIVMAILAIYLFNLYRFEDYFKATTITLTTLAVTQWYRGFNCQFLETSVFTVKIFRNPYLWLAILGNFGFQLLGMYTPFMQKILKTTPLKWEEWLMIFVFGFSVIVFEELRKVIFRWYRTAKL